MDDPVVDLLSRRPPAADDEPERVRTLLELLDRPDRATPTVWVGGTHGRSSVVAMVVALLSGLDITAGARTTAHLQDLRERVRIAGAVIPPDALRAQLAYLDPFLREVDSRFAAPLSFEEAMAALAATWFADAPVDVVVAEGEPPPDARSDLRVTLDPRGGTAVHTADGGTRRAGTDFFAADRELAVGGQRVTLHAGAAVVPDVYLPLHGAHQADNAAAALAVVDAFLGGAGLDPDLIRDAFARLRLPGRLEVVRRSDAATVLLDAASDELGARALADALAAEFAARHRIGVLGLIAKDPAPIVRTLATSLDHVVVTAAPGPGATPPGDVLTAAHASGLPAETAETVDAALASASGLATDEDVILVAGSPQTVGAARRALVLEPVDDLLARA